MSLTRTEAVYSFGFTNGSTSSGGSITVNLNDWTSMFTESEVDSAVSAYLSSLSSKPGVDVSSAMKIVTIVEAEAF